MHKEEVFDGSGLHVKNSSSGDGLFFVDSHLEVDSKFQFVFKKPFLLNLLG